MSEDEATRAPGLRQHAEAGRDVYAAAGNIVFQNPSQSPEAAALKMRSASEGADLLVGLSGEDETLGRARAALTGVSTGDQGGPGLGGRGHRAHSGRRTGTGRRTGRDRIGHWVLVPLQESWCGPVPFAPGQVTITWNGRAAEGLRRPK